jgi:membrane protein YdbS with pleckstrin-like domain
MYCIKCGTNNSEEAKFCRKCGELMEAEEETQVAVRRDETALGKIEETGTGSPVDSDGHIFTIGPTLMFVKIGYALAAIGALLLVAVLSIFQVSVWISIILGLLLFLVPAFYHIKAKMVRYSLDASQIEVDTGLVSRTTRNIPLRRIQDVTVATSAMQRLLGFGDLVIDNASEEGGKIVMKNINTPKQYADLLLKQMHLLDK